MILTFLTHAYLLCALLLLLYTGGQFILLLVYLWPRCRPLPPPAPQDWPSVTVQLPLYNERFVAERLLAAVAALDYPRDRLFVQVLDDSTDETGRLVAAAVAHLAREGLKIEHLRRGTRSGYKAGALAHGLAHTDSELIAIFDADFLPPRDFLRRTVPHMVQDPQIGILQTRWGHLNECDNLLTRAQALAIDMHFVIEQFARSRAGLLLTFNGTCGLWRAQCIHEAGGWSDATLTEDLDLSYRVQLAGWRCHFLPDVVVPGEVPPQLAAYKQQQARWARGSTQCLLRLIGPIWRGRISMAQRLMAMQHLCQYLPHPLMLLLLLLTPPLLLHGALDSLPLAPLGLIGLVPPLLYAISQRALYADWPRRLLAFPLLVLLSAGLVWNNTLAVLAALLGRRGQFRRTPKFAHAWAGTAYALKADWTLPGEALLLAYACGGLLLALLRAPALAPYFTLYVLAFGAVLLRGLRDHWQVLRFHRMAGPGVAHSSD